MKIKKQFDMKKSTFSQLFLLMVAIMISTSTFAQATFKKEDGKFVYLSSLAFAKGINDIKFEGRTVQNNIAVISVHQVLAYKFNPHLIIGMGAGYDMWRKTGFIPLYSHITVNFFDNKWTPFFYMNAGYSFKWYVTQKPEPMTRVIHGAQTGAYGESGLGLSMKMNDKFSLLFSVNYKLQQTEINYSVLEPDQPDLSQIATNRSAFALYHFLGFKLGFLF